MKHDITVNEALECAKEFCLVDEVQNELNHGASPWEALYEWDLLEESMSYKGFQ